MIHPVYYNKYLGTVKCRYTLIQRASGRYTIKCKIVKFSRSVIYRGLYIMFAIYHWLRFRDAHVNHILFKHNGKISVLKNGLY